MKGNDSNPLRILVLLSLLVITIAESTSKENDSQQVIQDAPYNNPLTYTEDQQVENDQNMDVNQPGDINQFKEDSSEESKEDSNELPEPAFFTTYPDNSEYSSYSSGPYINTDMQFESSYEQNLQGNYPPFNSRPEDNDNDDGEESRRLQDMLCSILDLCDFYEDNDSEESDQEYSSADVVDNEITIDAQPLAKDMTIDSENLMDDDQEHEIKSRSKRSLDNNDDMDITHGHRAKRDLSLNMDEEEDDIVPLDKLEFLAALAIDEVNNEQPQGNSLFDVLDLIEGIRRDRLSAGDILEEFEMDEEHGGLPFDTANTDNVMRKRGESRSGMKHYVQSLPTLEGMRKRSDPIFSEDEIDLTAYPRDFVVAAENELAAEELQNIENKAQVATAMLDNAANLISVIENMAVDLVAEYLGLDDENEDDDASQRGIPLEFDEFQQYLPQIPPVSLEKRIGRERNHHYPSGVDHPFVSEDLQQPFKGTYEPMPKQRYPGVSYGTYRRPSYGSRYRGLSRAPAPPPFVDKHIGIFPNDNIFQPRYRRVQPNPYNDDTLPLLADDIADNRKSRDILSRVFSVGNGNAVGRLRSDGRPYLDGYFEDKQQDLRVEDGLQDAFDAALLMQNKIDRENQFLKNSNIGSGLEDAYLGNILSNIFRGRIDRNKFK